VCRALALALAIAVPIAVGGLLAGCAARQLARTVGAGRSEVGLLAGGPIQSTFGVAAPVPEHRVHGRVGVTDDLDVGGSLALAPLASAILAFDFGFVAQIARIPRFAISGSARLHCVLDLDDEVRDSHYPEVGIHMEQRLERWIALLGGSTLLFAIAPSEGRPSVFFAPYLGVELFFGEHAVSLSLGWINPWQDGSSSVRWEPAGNGAMVLTFGWRIQPGGVR
jgi:hypothetical protein